MCLRPQATRAFRCARSPARLTSPCAVIRITGGGALAAATNLAYPLGDVLLCALAIGGFLREQESRVVRTKRRGRSQSEIGTA